jgi:Rhodopirellula transposase DDE domain
VADNSGWVAVGTDHDTAAFAVTTIRGWWQQVGCHRYPHSRRLLISADGGGSNSYRSRTWKVELEKLTAQTGLEITVCHLPPGTSKWNKIEKAVRAYLDELAGTTVDQPRGRGQDDRCDHDPARADGPRRTRPG